MRVLFASFRLSEWLWETERLCEGPAGHGRALIVGGTGPSGTVAAASPEARLSGVATGMRMAEARMLCPQALIAPGRMPRLLDVLSAVHTLVGRHLPTTTWLDPTRAVLAVEADAAAELQRVIERIRHQLLDTFGLSLACGVAGTRLAADVAARLVAPSGFLHVLPGYETRVLAPVHLRWLDGVDARLIERFESAGCTTIGDLAGLEPARVDALAGGVGFVLARLARGDDPRRLATPGAPRRLTAYVSVASSGARPSGESGTAELLDAVARAVPDLLDHPLRQGRRVVSTTLLGWAHGETEQRRVFEPPGPGAWDDGDDILAVLRTDGLPLNLTQGCVSLQLETYATWQRRARVPRAPSRRPTLGATRPEAGAIASRRHSA